MKMSVEKHQEKPDNTKPSELLYLVNETNVIRYKRYRSRHLIALSDEFKSNRSFNSWAEVFHKSLVKHRAKIAYKKRSKEQLSLRFVAKIIRTFWQVVARDLIMNDVEVVLKDSKEEKNRFTIKMGYIKKPKDKFYQKMTWLIFPFGGVCYTLRYNYPQNWRNPTVERRVAFLRTYRGKVIKELLKGRRYYNSTKEKIFAKL